MLGNAEARRIQVNEKKVVRELLAVLDVLVSELQQAGYRLNREGRAAVRHGVIHDATVLAKCFSTEPSEVCGSVVGECRTRGMREDDRTRQIVTSPRPYAPKTGNLREI